jgi:Zn-dependent M28 family amino/carboxypeptidase
VAGSSGETRAAEYIRDQFRASGYAVEIVPFTFKGDTYRPATVSTKDAQLPAFTMTGSPGAKVTGAAVLVGIADAAAVSGRDLAGKIALADRGSIRFSEKVTAVAAAGAAGLIVINNEDGDLLGNIGFESAFPVTGVDRKTGDALRAAASRGESITVETPVAQEGHAVNVIARPSPGARCDVIAGGHHDTVPGTGGAHDNASGAAETIELARAFAAGGIAPGLCFVTFGAEESGLHGSQALVQALQSTGILPRAMINLDTVGAGTAIDIIGTGSLTQQAYALARALSIEAAVVELGGQFGSDHQSFAKAGVPVVFFATNDFSKIHTPADTIDTINRDLLANQGALAMAFIKELLGRVAQPAERS